MSFARLDVFGRGEVSGMMKAGLDREAISKLVKKRDGTYLSIRGVDYIMHRCREDPGWWGQLRIRLEKTAPMHMESRAKFIKRLRRTVTWMNSRMRRDGHVLCTNQKARAKDIRKLSGAKSRW